MNKRVVLLAIVSIAVLAIIWASFSLYQDGAPARLANQQANPSTSNTNDQAPSSNQQLPSGEESAGSGSGGGSSGGGSESPGTSALDEKTYCTPESRDVESCETNDHPVCGWYDTEQITCQSGPCVRSTFPNECESCMSSAILYWTEGECPIHE